LMAPIRSVIAVLGILLVGGCAAGTVPPPREAPPPAVQPPGETTRPAETPPREAPRPAVPSPRAVSPPSSADNNYAEGLSSMEEGKFERTLELFSAVWKEMPGHPGVEENFPNALEGFKKSGDEALRQGRPEEAGKRWTATLRFLSHPALKGRSPAFSKTDLKGSIDKLSENLMEKGLADYRQGRLEAAIATWRQILAYDPAHDEAAKSVRTATTQLENLKKLPSPPAGK